MSSYWQPYCLQKPGIRHDVTFENDPLCTFCGLLNPKDFISTTSSKTTEIIDLSSSPPAQEIPRFHVLDRSSNQARQESISRTSNALQKRPHAGSPILSSRPKPKPKSGIMATQFRLILTVCLGYFDFDSEQQLKSWTRWDTQCK